MSWSAGRRSALVVALAAGAGIAAANETGGGTEHMDRLRQEAIAFEHGTGGVKDGPRAAALYCQAARLGDASAPFDLGWMYANGRGVPRDDALAASFFRIAAERGVEQARNMMIVLGAPSTQTPECMIEPVAPVVDASAREEPAHREATIVGPKPIVDLVRKIAPQYQVGLPLVMAIIEAESNFKSDAVSPKNAQGLMQLVPETAVRFKVKNPFDPAQNVRGGIAYLRWLLAYFQGEISLVAAAYNAGERTVERYRGVPPYEETRAYVSRILAAVGAVAQPYDPSVAEPSPHLRQIRERQKTK